MTACICTQNDNRTTIIVFQNHGLYTSLYCRRVVYSVLCPVLVASLNLMVDNGEFNVTRNHLLHLSVYFFCFFFVVFCFLFLFFVLCCLLCFESLLPINDCAQYCARQPNYSTEILEMRQNHFVFLYLFQCSAIFISFQVRNTIPRWGLHRVHNAQCTCTCRLSTDGVSEFEMIFMHYVLRKLTVLYFGTTGRLCTVCSAYEFVVPNSSMKRILYKNSIQKKIQFDSDELYRKFGMYLSFCFFLVVIWIGRLLHRCTDTQLQHDLLHLPK